MEPTKERKTAKEILEASHHPSNLEELRLHNPKNIIMAMEQYAQQELQAYRDIIKELLPLAQNFASELRWDEEYSGDKVGGKEAQEIVDRANKLIDTVTPTIDENR